MISKFYYFEGNFEQQSAKLRQLNGGMAGSIRNYEDCMVLNTMFSTESEVINDEELIEVKIGSARWRYYFELAHEHLIELEALDGGDLNDVERIVELKIGSKLTNEDEFYSCKGTRESSADFERRMTQALAANAGIFFHRSKKFSFKLAKPKA